MTFLCSLAVEVRCASAVSKPFVSKLLLAVTIISGIMLALAVPNLISGNGWTVWLKVAVLALGATVVAYGVNRLAVDRSAPLANAGYPSAAVLSVVSILTVGTGMFMATFAGLTLPDTEKLRLEGRAEALSVYVADAKALAKAQRDTGAPIDPQGQRLIGLTLETNEPIWAPKGSSLLLGAAGSNKTTAGLTPWLYSYAAGGLGTSVLITDNKDGELARQTADMLADLGFKVGVIDDLDACSGCRHRPYLQ